MKKNHLKKQRGGFTLIELLVVISIIALLSSIVLASVTTARIKAQDVAVLQSLSQMQNIMALEYSDAGNYAGLQWRQYGLGPWVTVDTNCSDFFLTQLVYTGKYANEMINLCKSVLKYSPGIYFGQDPTNQSDQKYSIGAIMPSTYTGDIYASKVWCYGSSGKTLVTYGQWNNPGCWNVSY